ncbi:MAG: ParB/RepB/Spo0J family partition protein [Pseudomonadales bacterium]|nr:ParB/RepB/Spo0J family partition protein [Pseudomonadales bacterium]
MNTKKRGLGSGRGLSALLGQAREVAQDIVAISEGHFDDGELRRLPLHQFQRGRYQPRRDMDEDALKELSESIRQHGVMQPIVVRRIADDRYEIIAGERRWRAAQQAGLETIPAILRDISDETSSIMALIENIQREDLNPLEQAMALQRMSQEFDLTHEKLADTVGKSRASVTNLLRLLQLQPDVRQMLENGDIDMGHARALLGLQAGVQSEAARQVCARALSVRQTEELVRKMQQPTTQKTTEKQNPDVRRLAEGLSERLGAPVRIDYDDRGRGKLTIAYSSLDELDGILARIR